jgi:hypothetical protein
MSLSPLPNRPPSSHHTNPLVLRRALALLRRHIGHIKCSFSVFPSLYLLPQFAFLPPSLHLAKRVESVRDGQVPETSPVPHVHMRQCCRICIACISLIERWTPQNHVALALKQDMQRRYYAMTFLHLLCSCIAIRIEPLSLLRFQGRCRWQ